MTAGALQLDLLTASDLGSPSTLTYSPELGRPTKILILTVVTLVTCMEFLTSYAVSVALPDIQGDLAASLDEGSWILTVYSTCFLIGLVLSNWLSGRIGYRRNMTVAVMFFLLSSIGCGLSHTLAMMLAFRAVMGFAGGNFLVRAQTGIKLSYTGKSRVIATTIFALFVAAVARLWGPAVGGYLTEWYSWRYVFFLNVPLSLTALILLLAYLPDVKAHTDRKRLDLIGILLLVGWVASIQLVLSRGQRDDWFADPFIVALTTMAAVCLPMFIWWERRSQNANPIISLQLYRNRNFLVGSIYVVVLGMMLYGQLFVVPQFLRNVQQHSAFGTGQLQTLNAAAFAVGLIVGGLVMKRIGFRTTLGIGAASFAAGMWFWATRLTPTISDQAMFLPLMLTGFGAGWQVGPISTLINSETPEILMGEGMELYLCQRQLGGSWGTAILTILIDRRRSFWSGRLGENLHDCNRAMQDALHQGAAAMRSHGLQPGLADAASAGLLHGRLVTQSVVNAFADTFAFQAALGAFAIMLLLLFSRSRVLISATKWIVAILR